MIHNVHRKYPFGLYTQYNLNKIDRLMQFVYSLTILFTILQSIYEISMKHF